MYLGVGRLPTSLRWGLPRFLKPVVFRRYLKAAFFITFHYQFLHGYLHIISYLKPYGMTTMNFVVVNKFIFGEFITEQAKGA